jgi:hypothetical protein
MEPRSAKRRVGNNNGVSKTHGPEVSASILAGRTRAPPSSAWFYVCGRSKEPKGAT